MNSSLIWSLGIIVCFDWGIEKEEKRMENLRKDYDLPEGSTIGKILSYDFVENKTKNTKLLALSHFCIVDDIR